MDSKSFPVFTNPTQAPPDGTIGAPRHASSLHSARPRLPWQAPVVRRNFRAWFPRRPIVVLGLPFPTYWPHNPAYIRWQESMLPNWNGSMMEFWSMQMQRVLADATALVLEPSAKKYLQSPEFWPRIRKFLDRWVGPSYFVQEMQHRIGPDWVPAYPLSDLQQLRGQVPTYQWTGRQRQHAGQFAENGPLLGYGTPYTRSIAMAAARMFVQDWQAESGGYVSAPMQLQHVADRYDQIVPTPDMISKLAAGALVEAAGEADPAAPPIPIDAEQCVIQGLAMLKLDPALWAKVLEQAGSEQAVQDDLRRSCAKLVADCGGLTMQQCMDKLCPNMSPDQCKALIKDRFATKPPEEQKAAVPWWLVGAGAAAVVAAAASGYWYSQRD